MTGKIMENSHTDKPETLPTHEECDKAFNDGIATPLQMFIYNEEPVVDTVWRNGLRAAIDPLNAEISSLREQLDKAKENYDLLKNTNSSFAAQDKMLIEIRELREKNEKLVKGMKELFNEWSTHAEIYQKDANDHKNPFFQGKADAYSYCRKKLHDLYTWLGYVS